MFRNFTKYLHKLLIVFLFLLTVSCEQELETEPNVLPTQTTVENGYLSFSNKEDFNAYISQLDNSLKANPQSLKSSNLNSQFVGFHSLASKINRSMLKSETINGEYYDDVDVALIKKYIPDETLFYVLDTANRVKVAGEIYQITEAGTFIYTPSNLEAFNNLAETFSDTYLKYTSQLDSITYLFGEIKYVDTYGFIKNQNYTPEVILKDISGDINPSTNSTSLKSGNDNDKAMSEYTTKFNLITHNVGPKTVAGTVVSWIIGDNSWRETYYDDNARLSAKLYDISVVLGIYKKTGFRVKFETRIRCTKVIKVFGFRVGKVQLWYYWSDTNAEQMLVGMDYVKAHMDFTYVPTYSYNQTAPAVAFANTSADIFMGKVLALPGEYISGWASSAQWYNSGISAYGYNVTFGQGYDAAYNAGFEFCKKQLQRTIASKTTQLVTKSAAVMESVYSNGFYESKVDYLAVGLGDVHTNCKDLHVALGESSGGASAQWSTGSYWPTKFPTGFTPNEFKLDDAYIFGAVKHNGLWKGIRIVK